MEGCDVHGEREVDSFFSTKRGFAEIHEARRKLVAVVETTIGDYGVIVKVEVGNMLSNVGLGVSLAGRMVKHEGGEEYPP